MFLAQGRTSLQAKKRSFGYFIIQFKDQYYSFFSKKEALLKYYELEITNIDEVKSLKISEYFKIINGSPQYESFNPISIFDLLQECIKIEYVQLTINTQNNILDTIFKINELLNGSLFSIYSKNLISNKKISITNLNSLKINIVSNDCITEIFNNKGLLVECNILLQDTFNVKFFNEGLYKIFKENI